MSCNQGDLSPEEADFAGEAVSPYLVEISGLTLFVSNAPEQIVLNRQKLRSNLWRSTIVISDLLNPKRIRCFIWHVNETTDTVHLALMAQSGGGGHSHFPTK